MVPLASLPNLSDWAARAARTMASGEQPRRGSAPVATCLTKGSDSKGETPCLRCLCVPFSPNGPHFGNKWN